MAIIFDHTIEDTTIDNAFISVDADGRILPTRSDLFAGKRV